MSYRPCLVAFDLYLCSWPYRKFAICQINRPTTAHRSPRSGPPTLPDILVPFRHQRKAQACRPDTYPRLPQIPPSPSALTWIPQRPDSSSAIGMDASHQLDEWELWLGEAGAKVKFREDSLRLCSRARPERGSSLARFLLPMDRVSQAAGFTQPRALSVSPAL